MSFKAGTLLLVSESERIDEAFSRRSSIVNAFCASEGAILKVYGKRALTSRSEKLSMRNVRVPIGQVMHTQ